MKTISTIAIACLLSCLVCGGVIYFGTDDSRWLGSPMTIPVYNYTPNGCEKESLVGSYYNVDPSIQLGLRPDGVVVWRKRK